MESLQGQLWRPQLRLSVGGRQVSVSLDPKALGLCQTLLPLLSFTSLDWRMVRSGIHTVPTIVSQMRPLFHTSTVRPRSRRLISLCAQEVGT